MNEKKQMLIWNGQLVNEADWADPFYEDSTRVYEVLRLICFVPLFWDDHWQRLLASCRLMGCTLEARSNEMLDRVISLAKANHVAEGNVMITIFIGSEKPGILIRFIPHVYPTEQQYEGGIEAGVLHAERVRPPAKVVQSTVRQAANQIIAETGVYEVLLLNRNNELTEGSRSNLVLISNNELYTAPLKQVLRGITLTRVLELSRKLNYPIHFKAFTLEQLEQADALFITGTSPKVLPVCCIGQYHFNVKHPILQTLVKEYNILMDAEIKKRRS
ncbi:aminotransferase class IV [Roseimarinus sediminis]|uniref:aminotransferase class IV n=1 Tax=Roseimarinus sediminis TaxID=1610899 RepID=UPI003D2166C1